MASILLFLVLFLIPLFFWIYTIADILKSEFKDSSNKSAWLIAVIFVPVIGMILYFCFGTRHKLRGGEKRISN